MAPPSTPPATKTAHVRKKVKYWLDEAKHGPEGSPPDPIPVSRWSSSSSEESSSSSEANSNLSVPLAPPKRSTPPFQAPDTSDEEDQDVVMTDPFEVRMRFSNQLQNLNASVVSMQKAATYALKYKDMDEDLHSCIIEQLERNGMNTRANIMFFIEHFLEMATKEGHSNYVKMIQRDIIRVVDAVAPDDGTGAANVKIVRLVLQSLQAKRFLDSQTVVEIEEVIKERETSAHAVGLSSPVREDSDVDMPPSKLIPKPGRSLSIPPRLEKRQVEQRIEEDRERHKRARENIWAVSDRDEEIDRLWEETSDLGEDDHIMGREEFVAREAAIGQQCPHYEPRSLEDLNRGRL